MRRQYTLAERAEAVAAVAANDGSVHGTAKILGIPETSLRQWCKGQRHPELLPLSERKKRELARRLAGVAFSLLNLVEDRADELSGYEAAQVAGMAIDRFMLLSGGDPTSE